MYKQSACNAGDRDIDSIPGLGRSPGREQWQSNRVLLPGESAGTEEPAGLQSKGSQNSIDWAIGYTCTAASRQVIVGQEENEAIPPSIIYLS